MLIALQLAAALTVQGQTPPPPPHGGQQRQVFVFSSDGEAPGPMDANGDGSISREEFAAPVDLAFARMDKDGDGRLSTEELAAGGPPHGPGGPGGGDVVFWRGEPGEGGPHRFELRMDGEDGAHVEEHTVVVTRGDGPGGRPPVIIRQGGPGEEGGEDHVMVWVSREDGRGHPMPAGPGEHRFEMRRVGGPDGEFADIDANGDGRVTEEEFLAPMREAFRRMDADGSGALEEGERGGDRQVHVITREQTRDH